MSFFEWTDKDSKEAIEEAKNRLSQADDLFYKANNGDWDAMEKLVEMGYVAKHLDGRRTSYLETSKQEDDERTAGMTVEQMTRRMNAE
jgi:hypothetical protein